MLLSEPLTFRGPKTCPPMGTSRRNHQASPLKASRLGESALSFSTRLRDCYRRHRRLNILRSIGSFGWSP